MMDEQIDRVDKNGRVIGIITRRGAYDKGFLHPAVNIILVNSKGEIYLQKRSAKKAAFPLYWDISASEHVMTGESFENAAKRGLFEELSVRSKVKLIRPKHIQRSKYEKNRELINENELVELYATVYNGKIKVDKTEVESGEFFQFSDLKNFNINNFTPWGLDEIKFIQENYQIIDELKR